MADKNTFLAISDMVLGIATFLDMQELAFLDRVCLLDPDMRAQFWQDAAWASVGYFPLWGAHAWGCIEQLDELDLSPKQYAQDVAKLRRTFFPSEAWEPWISKVSFCSMKIAPHTDYHLEGVLYWGEEARRLPDPAAVPLSGGVNRGQPLVVCMTISSEGNLYDNICIGVEGRNYEQSIPTIMFAPFSGHCFHRLELFGPTFKASVLKPLDVVPLSLRVWIQVVERGAIRILRQVEDQEPEDAGVLPVERISGWIDEYFTCVYSHVATLKATATVSVEHVGGRFPTWFVDKPARSMDAVWEMLDPELWQ